MKTDRFTWAFPRTAAVLLACLFVTADRPATGQITFRVGGTTLTVESSSKRLAKALAQEVEEVRQRFGTNRRALRAVQGPDGASGYSRQEVAGLIARTGEDLDKAIENVGEPGLAGLRAWSAEEHRRIEEEIAAHTPRAVARVASLGGLPLFAAAPQQETVPAETSDRLLDRVGEVVNRIFFLASHDDLEVKLWAGSTPAQKVTFRFRPQGQIKGSTPAPTIIQTNGTRNKVLRGLYVYEAAWAKGAVTELIKYPNPAGASAAVLASERLDLVNGSSFFCCRFDEQYCQHVASEKECSP